MKATIVSTFDTAGGAALAGYAISQSLNQLTDIETRIVCKAKHSVDENVAPLLKPHIKWVDRYMNQFLIEPTIGQNYWLPLTHRILKHKFIVNADAINLHNIHGDFIAYPVIYKLVKIAPVFVSMHDMWYLTGHCAYSFDCDKWLDGCRRCPYPDTYPKIKRDTAAFHWEKKKELYADININFLASSRWLQNLAKKSPLLDGKEVVCVYNPYDTNALKPRDKKLVRKLLDLPDDKNIAAFGAASIHDRRKGFPSLLAKIDKRYVKENNLFLLIMGRDPQNLIKQIPDWLPFRYFGQIPSEEFRSLVYNAADVFIFPTMAENLSNMLIEALASGTPCVTFDVGGCGEVIQTGRTGYLARPGDFKDFMCGVATIANDSRLQQEMSRNARQRVMADFTYEACAKGYERLMHGADNH